MIIRTIIKNAYYNSGVSLFLKPVKLLYDFYRFRLISEKTYLKRTYKDRLGRYPNLDNPKLFTEKIQWLKLHDRTPLHTQCADKYLVRDFVKERVGGKYLIPLVFSTESVSEIKFENLPEFPVIIKVNHDSGGTAIIRDKGKVNFEIIRENLTTAIQNNYYLFSKEWQYKNIPKRIIVEKLLVDSNGEIPNDYKIFCFNGHPEVIQVDIERYSDHRRNLYDTDWNLLPFKFKYPNGKEIEKPDQLDEILFLAKSLSNNFVFARVDFYVLNNNIYFGEITFHPESGFGMISPVLWDKKLGDLLNLKINSEE